MSTTMNFNLSPTLQSTLTAGGSGNGVYAYAIAFGSSTANGAVSLVTSATLINDGVVDESSITLPSPTFFNGDVYVLIQQGGDGNLLTSITDIGDINPANAVANNYSYQLFEATLSGSPDDQGDISAVNTFGFAATFEIQNQDLTTDQRGFNTSGANIFAAIPPAAVVDYQGNNFPNAGMLASGPATADNAAPWPANDWMAYVTNLKRNSTVQSDIQIVASFAGGSPLQSDPMISQYSVQYVAEDQYGKNYFWLIPDTSNGATNTDWIRIPVPQLKHNIYIQPGSLEVHQGGKDGNIVTYDSFTPNNADGQVAQYFVAGFDAGFWGGSGTSPNSNVLAPINFNKTWNWTVDYAYNAALNPTAVTYTNVLGTGPGTVGGKDRFYDPWAAQFLTQSNAYGYSYSDLVSAGGVNPQMTMWDVNAGTNVGTINITLFDNSETPSSGFKASSGGYIAPPAGGYHSSLTATGNQLSFTFGFTLGGTLTFTPNANTPISLKIYAPDSPHANKQGFVSLNVTGPASDWYYYTVGNTGGKWSLTPGNANAAGTFTLMNLPSTSDGTVSWYKLVYGAPGARTIYNIYATTDPTTHEFTNVVVDHGVQATMYSSTNYSLDFAPGGRMTYDIATYNAPPKGVTGVNIVGSGGSDKVDGENSAAGQPLATDNDDTINGNNGDDDLSGLFGYDTINGGPGKDILSGGPGDDILQVRGSEGVFDTFDGGAGIDTLQFLGKANVMLAGFNAAASSIETLEANGLALIGTNQADVFNLSALLTVTGLAYVDGGSGSDTLIGSRFADNLRGGAGDDTLDGRAGADILRGGAGNDTILGRAGNDTVQLLGNEGLNDTIDGGADTDTLQFLGKAKDNVFLAGFDAAASSIEIVLGTGSGLFGTSAADVFDFSALTSISGVAFIDGGGGHDTLIGSNFADTLRGGIGDDTLDGRGGNDLLDGGTGNNTYVFADGYGSDTVAQYQAGKDKFDFTGVAGVNNFADLTLTQITPNVVLIDFDGIAGGETLTIRQTTVAILTANQSDFLF